MFRFAHPEYLYALYLVPLFIILFWFTYKRRKILIKRFVSESLQDVLLPDFSRMKTVLKFILYLGAIVLIILAAANPQVGTKMKEVKQSGIDVYIALDVSNSMRAEDLKPNRLEMAKLQISNLIKKLRGDRIGLIVFAGKAYIQFPLTIDYSAANLFLSAVDFTTVPQQGTAIASAINLATQSFDTSATEKVIIIITDGEDHEGDVVKAVKNAKEKGIKIFTIGLGSPDGAPIPVYNARGEQVDYKRDRNGEVVLTKLNEEILISIASEGNGKYFRGNNFEDHLDKIYTNLSELEKTEFGVKKITDYEDRFYYLLIPALLLLITEFLLSERKTVIFTKINTDRFKNET
ncbi:MAG: VWA domain-containing protein [Ignavibacteriaceae bacterium]